MRKILLASTAALALSTQAMADETYSLKLPAMGAAVLPGPRDATGQSTIVKTQIVDASGYIDWVFYEYGQNWTCLGDENNNNANDWLNYPRVGLYIIPASDPNVAAEIATYGGILGQSFSSQLSSFYAASTYDPTLVLDVARPLDYDTTTKTCPAEGNNCHQLLTYYWSVGGPYYHVNAGDIIVWAVARAGLNCPGNAYAQTYLYATGAPTVAPPPPGDITISGVVHSGAGPWGNANYPTAPGGDLELAIHVH